MFSTRSYTPRKETYTLNQNPVFRVYGFFTGTAGGGTGGNTNGKGGSVIADKEIKDGGKGSNAGEGGGVGQIHVWVNGVG